VYAVEQPALVVPEHRHPGRVDHPVAVEQVPLLPVEVVELGDGGEAGEEGGGAGDALLLRLRAGAEAAPARSTVSPWVLR
jgi:hypothetical protein